MRNVLLWLLAAVLFPVAGSQSLAQVKADFAGQWELLEGIPDSPLFRDGRIEQDAGTITLTTTTPNPLFREPRVFRFDGTETTYTHRNVRGDETWVLVSTARWIGAALHVTTVTTRSGAQTFIPAWESLMTLSIDDAGRLVLVRTEPTVQGTLATIRAVYRKK